MTLGGDGAARRFCVFIRILFRCLAVSEKLSIFAIKNWMYGKKTSSIVK